MFFDLQRFSIKTVDNGSVYEVTLIGGGSSDLSSATGTLSAVTVGNANKACLDSAGNQITTSYLKKNTNDTLSGNFVVTGTESVGGSVTIYGDLRLKGSGNYGNKLNFGDGDYVYFTEPSDDVLEIKAKQISLTSSSANSVYINGTNVTALGGGGTTTLGSGTAGTLPVTQGGTGATVLSAITVGKASSLETARNIVASLGSSVAGSFQGTAAVTVGTQGTLPVNKGGTGVTTATPMFYGTCSTAASTVAKAVTCSGFVLTTGAQIVVKFTNTSTATAPTLNVNSTGAKTIQYQGYSLVSGALRASGFYHFLYDGTYWQVVGPLLWTE